MKFILPGMTLRMALTKKPFRTHTNIFQFNRSLKNLIVLKETSKVGKTSQRIFGKIDSEHPGPHGKGLCVYELHACSSLLCSATLGNGVCKPLSQVPAMFC